MYFGILLVALSAVLVASQGQFPQYPPQFSDNPLPTSFNPFNQNPFRGGYQLRSPPPPRFNAFDHVYNENGEKLTCKMVCSPQGDSEDIDVEVPRGAVPSPSEKKESGENKIEKKQE